MYSDLTFHQLEEEFVGKGAIFQSPGQVILRIPAPLLSELTVVFRHMIKARCVTMLFVAAGVYGDTLQLVIDLQMI